MLLVLFWSIPETIETYPEWLDKLFTPAEVCKLQTEALKHAVQSLYMLRLIYDNSSRLRTLFTRAVLAEQFVEAGVINLSAQRRLEQRLTGTIIPELDQLSAANRGLFTAI